MQRILHYTIIAALTFQILGVPPHVVTQPDVARAAARINYLGVAGKTYIGSTPPNPPNLQSGLVSHWTFDGADMIPNVRDKSGRGNHGSLSGFAATTSRPGMRGQGLLFDGGNDSILISDSDSYDVTNFTIAAWVKLPTTLDTGVHRIFTQQNAAGGPPYWGMVINNQQLTALSSNDGITYPTGASYGSSLNDGSWHFVAIRRDTDADTFSYFRDGSLVYAPSMLDNSGYAIASMPRIGTYAEWIEWFVGDLDDLRVYNRALSASEVVQLYKLGANAKQMQVTATPPNLQSGLVGHWTFDGPDMVSNVRDKSGQGNHGTLSGFTSTTTVPGRHGQALNLDGSNDYVSTVNVNSLESGDMTLCVWVNPASLGTQWLLQQWDPTSSGMGPALWTEGSVGNRIHFEIGTFPNSLAATRALTLNVWQQVCATASGTTLSIYYNGALDNSGSKTRVESAANELFTIGGPSESGVNTFSGKMDDVRIYNRALSAAEVLQLYNLGR